MSRKIEISKEDLVNLYENEKLSTFEIADKLNCCQATIWKRLKEFGIRARLVGRPRVNITKEELEELYVKRRLSNWKIEKEIGICRSTVHRKLQEFGLVKSRAESHIVHPRKDFSGDFIEKAYLIGFRLGDLGVRKIYPNSKTICVASGSTIPEQIALIESLFENYGKVWSKKTCNNKINIQVSLNESFDFLICKEFPDFVEKDKKLFFSFLGGFSDAEGCISNFRGVDYYSLGNYDDFILFRIHDNLHKFGIGCNPPISDKRKGKCNSQGYVYSSNYWSLKITKKEDLMKLLLEIKPYLRHAEKVKSLNKAIASLILRNKLYGVMNENKQIPDKHSH